VRGRPDSVPARKTWIGAEAVLLDGAAARRCADAGLPRRAEVYLLAGADTGETADPGGAEILLQNAVAIGAQQVYRLPDQAGDCVSALAALTDRAHPGRRGSVIAVLGGRGGAGASVFAGALALTAQSPALLIDLDPWGGGADLLVGGAATPGLRWPEIGMQDGRLEWDAIRSALPRYRAVSVLATTRRGGLPSAAVVDAVIDAGRRGGATVVCDVPRTSTDVTQAAVDTADLVALVVPCDVRSCAAAEATVHAVRAVNPNIGVVVRGPAPGGLRPAEIATVIGVPLLASMRPEPLLAERLERAALTFRSRSPLAGAARAVLEVLVGHRSAAEVNAA